MNDSGDHVGGVTGTLRSIGFAMRHVNATRCIVVFDGKKGSQSRKKIFSGYKAKRETNKLKINRQYADMMTEEDERESMKRQYVWLSELLHVLPITTMIYDGVEADDVMAYISTKLIKEGEQSILMSTDKDFLQLVNDHTIVWSPTKKKIYNQETIREEFGMESKNILLYRILDGDDSDEIPGIKGCGIKTLIKRFPEITGNDQLDIDDLFILSEQKRGKIKLYDTILESKDQLVMNRQLMQLKDPIVPGNEKMNILSLYNEKLKPINKIQFLKVAMRYEMVNSLGDIPKWLNGTFNNIVID